MVMVVAMMVMMPVAAVAGAAHLGKGPGKRVTGAIEPRHRLFDQGGDLLKAFLAGRRRPFDKLRLMAVVVFYPVGQ